MKRLQNDLNVFSLINPKYSPLIPVLLSAVHLGKVNQFFLTIDTMNLSFLTSVQSPELKADNL